MTRIDPPELLLAGAGVILPVLLHLRRGAVGLGDLNLDCGNSCGRTVDPITVCGVLGALLRVKEPDATRLDDRRAAACRCVLDRNHWLVVKHQRILAVVRLQQGAALAKIFLGDVSARMGDRRGRASGCRAAEGEPVHRRVFRDE